MSGDAATAQLVAGGTWPAKERARTRQALKKRGPVRVGLPLGCAGCVGLSCHLPSCMNDHIVAVASAQLASCPVLSVDALHADALRAACVERQPTQTAGAAAAHASCLRCSLRRPACSTEAASAAGSLLITPHNTRALRGAALAGQRPVNDTAHARVRRAELRTVARSLAHVGVRIIALHATSVAGEVWMASVPARVHARLPLHARGEGWVRAYDAGRESGKEKAGDGAPPTV